MTLCSCGDACPGMIRWFPLLFHKLKPVQIPASGLQMFFHKVYLFPGMVNTVTGVG